MAYLQQQQRQQQQPLVSHQWVNFGGGQIRPEDQHMIQQPQSAAQMRMGLNDQLFAQMRASGARPKAQGLNGLRGRRK
ncbi:hypothetical protein FGO68_gene321 [Halteria grandinella]|uniref:Uncharacterized protein n=1 Tax=Halteria grandinella TaxID=5974 RepID=A0A8J8NT68_HALGN|nr:hypothetical protein FGO68_gene321 [Halteria grandinella]